jgi:5-methylcytosine-specific restriction endonuclease McrA
MKRCSKCKTWKSKAEFYKNASNKDGLQHRCKQCHNEEARNYRESNPNKVSESQRKWAQENRDKKHENDRKYYESNSEKKRESVRKWKKENPDKAREWRQANPDKVRSHNQAHLARKAGNGGSFTDKEWQDLCSKYDNRCLCCGEKKKLTADHVVPLVKGGTSYIDNIQCLCQSCNSSKGTKTIDYRRVIVFKKVENEEGEKL